MEKDEKISKMKRFILECLELPYTSNKNGEHEDAIEKLLLKNKLEYKAQPNGTHKFPDFYVFHNGRRYSVECKSSAKTAKPTYNSGLPHKDGIYIFSSKRHGGTTIFMGRDVITNTKRREYSLMIEDLLSVIDKHRKTWKEDDRGFNYYLRNMFTQSGKKDKTDYFTHKDRERCEENVLREVS